MTHPTSQESLWERLKQIKLNEDMYGYCDYLGSDEVDAILGVFAEYVRQERPSRLKGNVSYKIGAYDMQQRLLDGLK